MGPAKQVRLYLYGRWCAPHSQRGVRRVSLLCGKPAMQTSWGLTRLRTFEGVEPMGRGRAKAKQVKVARQLKYNSGGTDLDRLRSELGVGMDQDRDQQDVGGEPAYSDLADPYADHAEDTGDDEDEDENEGFG